MTLIQSLKNKYRSYRLRRWNRLYDENNTERVGRGLKILADQGRTLSSTNSKKAEEYSHSVLGSIDFSPWLKLYSAYRGEFLEGWIPDNYLGRIVCPAVNGKYRIIGELKTLSRRILQTEALPDVAYFIKGNWISIEGEHMTFQEMVKYLFDQNQVVFVKKNQSQQGKGVFKLDVFGFSKFDFKSAGDFVIQAPIRQHSFFEELSPGSVATLRITTVKTIGQPAKNRLSGLRVGLKGMDFINSAECLRVPIWIESGELFSEAISSNWTILEVHPDTKVKFAGKVIPEYLKAVRLCEELHDRFSHFQLIGWDVSIEENGEVKIMEWNTDEPGIVYSEASNGPHFKGLGWENLWKNKKP